MNRRGFGVVGFIFLMIFLIIMWALIFASYFTLAGQNAVAAGATGLEAFLWTNLNLWFFFVLLLVCFVYLRWGGEQ